MPLLEGKEYHPSAEVAAGLQAPEDVFVIRFTGEVFQNYEDYIKAINHYRQRIWACKYSGRDALTFEEAATSEHATDDILSRFPAQFEAIVAKMVHHAVKSPDDLSNSVWERFQTTFFPGERVLGNLASGSAAACTVKEVVGSKSSRTASAAPPSSATYVVEWDSDNRTSKIAAKDLSRSSSVPGSFFIGDVIFVKKLLEAIATAEPVSGIHGENMCLWRLLEHFREKHGLPAEIPRELAERLRPARARGDSAAGDKLGGTGSKGKLTTRFSAQDEETYDVGDENPEIPEEEHLAGEFSDLGDDDYKPSRFNVEDLPWRARGRGGRTRGRGRAASLGQGEAQDGAAILAANDTENADGAAIATAVAATPGTGGGAFAAMDIAVESVEDAERRMAPGSIKHSVLMLLKEAGEVGMTVQELSNAIQRRGLRSWDEPRQARNSVASTCGNDPAFIRVAPARFALRALLPMKKLQALMPTPPNPDGVVLTDTAARGVAAVEAQQAEAMKKLREQQRAKGRVTVNNFKCPKCHRVTSVDVSPLALCDSCPRSYHVSCLGVALSDLPLGEWTCPKCVETMAALQQRLMDLQTRKANLMERAASKERLGEQKLVRRLISSNELDRRRSEPHAVAGQALALGLPSGLGAPGGRLSRRGMDDWEVLEEEKEAATRLEVRVGELQELAERVAGGEGKALDTEGGAGNNTDMQDDAPRREDSNQEKMGGDGPAMRAAEAAEALARLKLILEGPVAFPELPNDASVSGALREATNVAEFLALYGGCCEVPKELSTTELLASAAWPLEHAGDLGGLYRQMLLCCLLELQNRDAPIKSRAMRWYRVLSDASWPEVLRRYLLATRGAASERRIGDDDVEDDDDDDVDVHDNHEDNSKEREFGGRGYRNGCNGKKVVALGFASGAAAVPAGSAQDKPTGDQEHDVDIDVLQLDDRALALHCASLLGKGGWWEMPAVAHLRLLSMLCYDVANGATLRADIGTRIAEYQKIQQRWGRERAAKRRQKRTGDAGAGSGGNPSASKKAKTAAGGKGNVELADDSKKGSIKGADASIADDGNGTAEHHSHRKRARGGQHASTRSNNNTNNNTNKSLPPASSKPRDREIDLSDALEDNAYRTDPLGHDRHGRRYWWLRGTPGYLFVETVEGESAGVIAKRDVLDDLMGRLSSRGPREGDLLHVLRSRYADIIDSFGGGGRSAGSSSELAPLDVTKVKRPKGAAPPAVLRQKPAAAALKEVRQRLEAFFDETEGISAVQLGSELSELRASLRDLLGAHGCSSEAMCDYLLHVESSYCAAGEGLPQGADNAGMAALLGAEDASQLPEVRYPPQPEGEQGMVNAEALAQQQDEPVQERHGCEAEAMDVDQTASRAPQPPQAVVQAATVDKVLDGLTSGGGDDAAAEAPSHDTATIEDVALQTSSAAVQAGDGGPLHHHKVYDRPVSPDDDLDDSEAECMYLREKRMRRPARLWRSPRERGVWLKSLLATKNLAREGSSAAPFQASFLALMLMDRAGSMLERVQRQVENEARWEAAERRAAAQRADRPESRNQGSRGDGGASAEPAERPLMIRTGKSKTENGVKLVLKAIGKKPFPPARAAGPAAAEELAAIAADAEAQAANCRWGYQCSVCLMAGDLLCCEHPDGCSVSVHPSCTGLSFPVGPWICTNHEDAGLKGRARRRGSWARGVIAHMGDDDDEDEDEDGDVVDNDDKGSEASISDDTETEEEDSDGDSDGGFGTRRRSRR